MAAFDEISAGIKEAFNAVTPELFPGASLELLEVDDTANGYLVIENLAADWFLEFSEYRNQFKLQIARDITFKPTILQTTDVRIANTVYHIERASTLEPLGDNPVWTLFCGEDFRQGFRKY